MKNTKRILAMVLTVVMILSLFANVVFATETKTADRADTIANGDKVVIVCDAYGKALRSCGTSGFYNAGADVTVTGGKIADDAVTTDIVWDVTVVSDGVYQFSQGGDKLAMGASYSSMPANEVNDTWALEKVDGGYYIKNIGRACYVEWFEANNYFSGYHTIAAGSEGMFTMNFYKVADGTDVTDPTDPDPTDPDPTDPTDPPVDPADVTPIADVLKASEGEFTVKGVVTMVDGKNIYVQDATGGIDGYFATAPADVALGDTITVTGTRAVFNGLPELTSATYTKSEGMTLTAADKTISTLSATDICCYVSIKDLEITELYFGPDGTYTKPNVTLKDAEENTIQLYKAAINSELKVGDKVDVKCAVGINNADLQLRNTLETEITKAAAAEDPTSIVILYTNDVHTYIDKGLSYASIAALKDELAAKTAGTLLVDAGDHIQGTAYGAMDEGATIIELMNAAGYDAATLGNHEFDYGMDRTLEIIDEAAYSYLSCNFNDVEAKDTVLEPYKIFEVGGKKIAIVGVTTPESITKSTPAYFMDEKQEKWLYTIDGGTDGAELYATVQKTVDAARADGADYVIGLGHLGVDPSSQPWTSEEVIANTKGFDAFIDGHSHSSVEMKEVKDKDGKNVVLTQTGNYFNAIGKMTITEDGIKTEMISEYAGVDTAVKDIQDKWVAEVDEMLGEVIAHTDIDFKVGDDTGRLIRKQETNLGDFCADALYYLFNETEKLDCDVAVMNGGGIRADMLTGDISYKTTKTVHTFGNVACLMTVTGQQILDALEWGARDTPDAECGGFLHTAGLKFEIHTNIPSTVQKDANGIWTGGPTGEYRVQNVQILNKETGKYEPLDLKAKYNLAGYNYTLRDLGDGFAMFSGAELVKDFVMQDYLVLANYAQSFPKNETTGLPTITAENSPYGDIYGEGRITMYSPDVCEAFTDIDQDKWYHEGIHFMLKNGYMEGMGNGLFMPNAKLTRGQLVTLLYRIAGKEDVSGYEHPFTDVAANRFYADPVTWAYHYDLVKGITETTFCPEDTASREMVITILYRYAKGTASEEDNLKDHPDADQIHKYAREAMNWAVGEGYIKGDKEHKLNPRGNMTRAEYATMMARYLAE